MAPYGGQRRQIKSKNGEKQRGVTLQAKMSMCGSSGENEIFAAG
jgi:hypothetical protein